MGLFSTMKGAGKTAGKVGGGRVDLGVGTYLLKVERLETPNKGGKPDGTEYLKVHFTNLLTVADPEARALAPKAQPTYVIFPDNNPNYAFAERDMRQLVQGLTGATDEQINAAPIGPPPADPKEAAKFKIDYPDYKTGDSIAEVLEKGVGPKGVFNGRVVECQAWIRPNQKNPGKGFQKASFRLVKPDEVKQRLSPEAFKEFFPQ